MAKQYDLFEERAPDPGPPPCFFPGKEQGWCWWERNAERQCLDRNGVEVPNCPRIHSHWPKR